MRKFYLIILLALMTNHVLAQQSIKGKVTDENGEPLPGVNVLGKGTNIGTITDVNGAYVLSLNDELTTLFFSYVGYLSEEVEINGRSQIDVTLIPDIQNLEEVVVVGYGTVKKSDLTGSVVSIKSDELTERPVPSIGQAIQGKAPGVLVRTRSAAPGGGVSIIVRGHNSVNSNSEPLYVVDGIALTDISNIPVEDIESVEILKDASATAIYGSRGSNGVVLVTTKKGEPGKPVITYSNRFTVEAIREGLNLMNGREFATFYTDWEIENGVNPDQVHYNGSFYDRPLPQDVGEGTDWFDQITRNGFIQNHQLGISGGSERSKYALSLNYLDHQGIIVGGDYDRLGLKFSNSYDVAEWLTAGVDLFLTKELRNSSGENVGLEGTNLSAINPATKMPPTLPVYNPDGGYQINNLPSTQNLENPVAAAREYLNQARLFKAIGKFYLDIKPFEGFSFKIGAGTSIRDRKRPSYKPSNTIIGGLLNGDASIDQATRVYLINDYIASYKKQLNDIHSFDIVGGFSYEEQTDEFFGVSATDFFTDEFSYNNIDAASNFGTPSSGKNKWQLASWLGRVNYGLKDKYLLTFTGRYDGSSRFGEGNKWAFFPSVAAAWRISNESFMQNIKPVSFLKLRASWGEAGNSNIGLYRSLATFSSAFYPFGTAIQPGVAANRLANEELKWETTETFDVALDIGLFDDRLNLTIDAYYKKTRDLLLDVALIETSGFETALRNVGKLDNKGIEFILDAKAIDKEGFKWNITGNLFFNRNEIKELTGDATQTWKIGNPLGVVRTAMIDGIIRTQEELDAYVDDKGNSIGGAKLGDYKRVDLNGDGRISGDDDAIVFDPNPDFTYSLTNNFTYGNFGLSIFLYGTHGNQVWNQTKGYFLNTVQVRNNLSRELLNNTWTPENPNAEFPALSSPVRSIVPEIEDGSFLRLQNVMLTYNLPDFKVFKSASVYVSGQNLFTITDYTGWDPDVSSLAGDNSNQNFGRDRASYPLPRSYTIGFRASF